MDFRACGQAAFRKAAQGQLVVECKRRPEIGYFDPTSITFEQCTEWKETDCGYLLDGMKVLILGMDGYLGLAAGPEAREAGVAKFTASTT